MRCAVATIAVTAGLLATAHLAGGTVTIRLPDDPPTVTAEPTTAEPTTGGAVAGGAILADGCPAGGGLPFGDRLPFGDGLPSGGGLPFGGGGGGTLETLDVRFSVAGGPAAVAGATGALVVVAVCWLVLRFRGRARRPHVVRWWPMAGIAVAGLLAAGLSGGAAAAGGALLALPVALAGALPIGLGVPFTVRADGVLGCALDGAEPITPTGALMWVSGVALLVVGVLAAARAHGRSAVAAVAVVVRTGVLVGAALAGLALLGRAGVELGAFGGTVPLLDARLGADPLIALATGALAGAAAGLAGIALVRASRSLTSVSWRPWKDRARP